MTVKWIALVSLALVSVSLAPVRSWAENAEPAPMPQLISPNGYPIDEYVEAKQLMSDRKWVEAVVMLRSALKKSPRSSQLEMDLTKALAYSGRREEALAVLGQIINRKGNSSSKELIQRARVLSRLFLTNTTFQIHQDGVNLVLIGKYRAAREKFEKAIEGDPANVETLTRLGQCLVLDGNVDSAAEHLRTARRLNPYEPEIHLWLGHALHERGELRDALAELKSAYQDLPGSELSALWYSDALYSSGQKQAAIQVMEDDTRRHPSHVATLISLSRFRLLSSSTSDSRVAWQARKELQLALSRLPLYVSRVVDPTSVPAAHYVASSGASDRSIDPMGDLSLNLKRPEAELKRDVEKLMEEVENRIEGMSPSK